MKVPVSVATKLINLACSKGGLRWGHFLLVVCVAQMVVFFAIGSYHHDAWIPTGRILPMHVVS